MKAWLLPVLAAGIAVPIAVGFLLGGPGVGLAVGILVAFSIVVIAIGMKPVEEIEVERPADDRRRILVVAIEAVDEPPLAGLIADVAAGEGAAGEADVLVLAPALNTPAAHWASDLGEARFKAQRRLALSVGTLAAAGVEARGQVGDTDTVQAVEDALRTFGADEVVFVTPSAGDGDAVADVKRRLNLPVRELRVAGNGVAG